MGHSRKGVALVAILIVILGCGGSGGVSSSSSGGNSSGSTSSGSSGGTASGDAKADVAVDWPTRGRAIPYTSNSLVVTIASGTKTVAKKVIARPSGTTVHSSVEIDGLPVGGLTASIQAFPSMDGSGVAQATGTATFQTSAASVASIPVSLTTTVASLTLSSSASVVGGSTLAVSAAAKDAGGNTVLLTSGNDVEAIAWSSDTPGVASIVGTGPSATISGIADGQATIRATFTTDDGASTIVGAKTVTVQTAGGTVVIQ